MSRYEGVIQKIYSFVKKNDLIRHGEGVVTALSGGADSVFLLHALLLLKDTYHLRISAVHVNHGARGEEADQDEEFCRNLCSFLNVPLLVQLHDVPAYAREHRLSFEDAGRRIRREAFRKAREHFGAEKTATGHTADDQAETVLMRIITGAGISGLGGIHPDLEGEIIRPLLAVTKNELLRYLKEHAIPHREDRTNRDPAFLRNRVRMFLVPLIEKEFNPRIVETLSHMAEIFRNEAGFVSRLAQGAIDEMQCAKSGCRVPLGAVEHLPPSSLPFVLQEAIRRLHGEYKDITFDHLTAIAGLPGSPVGTVVTLPGGLRVEREYHDLVIRYESEEETPPLPVTVTLAGEAILPEWGLMIHSSFVDEIPSRFDDLPSRACFDFDKLGNGPFTIRSRKDGDRFQPLGMDHSKKLKEFFIDEKIPRRQRDFIPLLEKDGEIVWVIGIRPSDRFKIDAGTKRVLMVQIEQLEGEHYV